MNATMMQFVAAEVAEVKEIRTEVAQSVDAAAEFAEHYFCDTRSLERRAFQVLNPYRVGVVGFAMRNVSHERVG